MALVKCAHYYFCRSFFLFLFVSFLLCVYFLKFLFYLNYVVFSAKVGKRSINIFVCGGGVDLTIYFSLILNNLIIHICIFLYQQLVMSQCLIIPIGTLRLDSVDQLHKPCSIILKDCSSQRFESFGWPG